jgi:hypothetical protein
MVLEMEKVLIVDLRKVGTVVIVRERKAHSHHDKGFLFGIFADMGSAKLAYGPVGHDYEVTFEELDVMQA